MHGLHRLLNDRDQVLAQLAQVHLIAQGGTKGLQRLSRIVLAAVEAAVNELLDASAQRLEQGSNRQRGGDDSHVIRLADDATQQGLQRED